MSNGGPRQELAGRLRSFREDHFPGIRITQPDLARALGGVSVPLISSWESVSSPKIPPLYRLDAYAMLFSTARSFEAGRSTPLRMEDLTEAEREVMNELRVELRRLRSAAMQTSLSKPMDAPLPPDSVGANPWHFGDDGKITIVCGKPPPAMLEKIPYTNVDDPDYIDLLTYSDLDSLFELYGHLRAANPAADVARHIDGQFESDVYQGHLAILGGVDWNDLTRTILERLRLPIRQVADWNTEGEQYFESDINGAKFQYRPELRVSGTKKILDEDVALFVRAVNPFNQTKTVTICNGMYGRGTLGVVRALTDKGFRDRNSEYLRSRFGDSRSYCILSRVHVMRGKVLTPDWTVGDYTLFEWPG